MTITLNKSRIASSVLAAFYIVGGFVTEGGEGVSKFWRWLFCRSLAFGSAMLWLVSLGRLAALGLQHRRQAYLFA